MKQYFVTGIVGLAAASAYFLYTSQKQDDHPAVKPPEVLTSEVKAQVLDAAPVRTVEKSDAETALAKLGLLEPSDTIFWDGRTGDKGAYEFTNLTFTGYGDTATVASFEISGLRMVDDEKVYFDTMRADDVVAESGKEVITIGALGISLPNIDNSLASIPNLAGPDAGEVVQFFGNILEPGVLPELPEIFVENVKQTESRTVRGTHPHIRDSYENPQPKEVEDVTSLDFATLVKTQMDTGYELQANGFKRTAHNYRGEAGTTELMSLSVSGFDSDVIDKMKSQFGMIAFTGTLPQASKSFEPAFLSMDAQGFKFEGASDIVRIDLATVRHSDTWADQFTRRIDVPQISISAPPFIQDVENTRRSDNPFREFGYDDITLSYSSQTSYDRMQASIHEDETRLTASNAFDVSMSYQLLNVDGVSSFMQRRFMAAPENSEDSPMIAFGKIEVTDRGIMDRVFESMAEDREMTVEETRQAAIDLATISKTMASTDYQKEVLQSAIDAYGSWVKNGGKFSVSISPQRPMEFNEVGDVLDSLMSSPKLFPDEGDGFTTDDFSAELERDAADTLLRELNLRVEHN